MRTASKRLLAILCAATVIVGPVFAESGDSAPANCGSFNLFSFLSGPRKSAREAGEMTCVKASYGSHAAELAACNRCKPVIEKWKKQIPKAAESAVAADCAAAADGATRSSATTANVQQQLVAFSNNRGNLQAGQDATQRRVANADNAKKQFEECSKEIEDNCVKGVKGMMPVDQRVVEAVRKACSDAAAGAGRFSDQKKQDGMGLGDLAKAMGLAQQAMGMAQQAQGQQSPSDLSSLAAPGATSPTPASGNSQKPEILTAKLDGDKNGTKAPSIGFGNSVVPNQVASTQAGITGIGSTTGASSSPDAFGSPGSSSAGGPASGGEVGANAGSGGGAGGGGGNSTGASRPIDSIAAGASSGDGGYEVNGGGGRPMSGLKPSKADVDSVADGSILGAGDTKLDDLGREPASEGDMSAAPDEDTQNGSDSIFMRIRAKYSLLKGSGKI